MCHVESHAMGRTSKIPPEARSTTRLSRRANESVELRSPQRKRPKSSGMPKTSRSGRAARAQALAGFEALAAIYVASCGL